MIGSVTADAAQPGRITVEIDQQFDYKWEDAAYGRPSGGAQVTSVQVEWPDAATAVLRLSRPDRLNA